MARSPRVPRATAGQIQTTENTHVPEQSHPHRFSGSDAELHTNQSRSFTTFSLATKRSYRNDEAYVSRTEWHRCVVFGQLSEFAATLKKGAHIQLEGELRSRDYVSPKTDTRQRVWEIRVASILKLDRAEKAPPVEREQQDVSENEAAV
jgi:single-strand DNA-binding protein